MAIVDPKLLKKYRVCRSCESENITIEKYYAYHCHDCGKRSIKPRVKYTIAEGKEEDLLKLYNEIIPGRNDKSFITFSPYLARIVIIGNLLTKGLPPHIRNIKFLSYKNGHIHKLDFVK